MFVERRRRKRKKSLFSKMMNSKEMLCLLLLSLSVATGLKTAIGDGQVSTEFSLRLNGDLVFHFLQKKRKEKKEEKEKRKGEKGIIF